MKPTDEFFRVKEARRRDERQRQDKALLANLKRQKDMDQEQSAEAAAFVDLASAAISVVQAQAFKQKLERLETATVEALEINGEQLAEARSMLEALLAQAYVLPDGRRVFKTMDGQRVFDEFGEAVPPAVISPDQIQDDKPRWETFETRARKVELLTRERQELLDYQKKLDNAHDSLNGGNTDNAALDDLEKELEAGMPAAVRRRISGTPDNSTNALPKRLAAEFRGEADKRQPAPRDNTPAHPAPGS